MGLEPGTTVSSWAVCGTLMGELQFKFLVGWGLRPGDFLLDVGCGCLRGGVHFVRYLEAGHYFGIDVNSSLLIDDRLKGGRFIVRLKVATRFIHHRCHDPQPVISDPHRQCRGQRL